jgi:hypothetical protein
VTKVTKVTTGIVAAAAETEGTTGFAQALAILWSQLP